MTLLNHDAPLTQEQRPTILDALNRAVARGDKLFTGAAKENLDMMFTKLIIHEDLPLNLGESTYFHDFILEVSKGTYKGACHDMGLVKSDLRGSLLDTTLIDVMWAKQAP